jgi:hypothetical protein
LGNETLKHSPLQLSYSRGYWQDLDLRHKAVCYFSLGFSQQFLQAQKEEKNSSISRNLMKQQK